jgi:hypothetical protein
MEPERAEREAGNDELPDSSLQTLGSECQNLGGERSLGGFFVGFVIFCANQEQLLASFLELGWKSRREQVTQFEN